MNSTYPLEAHPQEGRPTASGALVTIATVVVFLAALSVRSRAVFALVLLALIFLPIEKLWSFTRSCLVIPLYAFGFSRATFGALLLVFAFQALFIHANVRLTFGPLRYVVATPEFHCTS